MFLRHLGGSPLLVTSASDLNAAGDCEFAFLRRVDEKLGRQLQVPRAGDPMLARAAELGDAHEARVLQHYRDRFGAAEVLEIRRPESMDPVALSARADESRAALAAGTRVIAQATFFDPLARPAAPELGEPGIAMLGFADFLVRDERGRYEVHDAKLARRARVGALLQLASYAEQLERLGVPRAEEAALILGDGSTSRHRLDEVAPVLGARRARLWQILLDRARARGTDGRRESAAPVAWGTPGVVACGRCEVCEPEVVRTRDPLLIAGLRRSQRDRLRAAGLSTIDAVAALVDGAGESRADASARAEVPGIAPTVLRGIAEQAAVQVRAVPGRPVPFTVVDPSALLALPAPDPGDLFFDFEGDPFFHEARPDGREQWGLDYLFGMCDTHERFTALWAHSLAEERDALERFLALVAERRRRFPGLRIYHYAAYERTHLLQIAARHGTGEEAVDQLLREHVLVDLYPIVARAVRVGSRSRSLKQLESLTVPGVPSRDGDAALLDPLRDDARVTTAVQSVTAYAEASALRASGDPAQRAEAERRLAEIADYNRADCVSTLRLREWLRSLAPASSAPVAPDADPVPPVPPVPRVGAPTAASGAPGTVLARSLAALADRRQVPAERRALALAGSAIEYHRREQKAFWWAQFSRLVDPVEEWAGTRDVLIVDAPRSAIVQPWSLAPRARREQRRVRLVGQFAPGSSVRAGSRVFLLYAAPPPFADPGAAPGARAARQATVLERHADGVTVEEALPVGGERFERLPMAVAPGPPPPAGSQREAIEEWGSELLRACERDTFPESAVLDLLLRRPPRLRGGAALRAGSAPAPAPGSDDDGGEIEAVLAGVRLLDRSTLAVQGPPGTGKTFLAAQVIRRLVAEDGWRVGVVAQSHRVVEHLLDGVVAAGLDPARVGKAVQSSAGGGASPSWRYTVIPRGGHAAFLRGDDGATRGCVLGGTAWDFSNPSRVARGSLDLLVIDEAGQFSLAPTIAASVAAERLLLLGDPQQLPQVSQGLHGSPSIARRSPGCSASGRPSLRTSGSSSPAPDACDRNSPTWSRSSPTTAGSMPTRAPPSARCSGPDRRASTGTR